MNRILPLFIFLVLFGLQGRAQNLYVSDTVVQIDLSGNEFLKIVDVSVRNNSGNETINVFWERITNDLPNNYISYICDNNICYGPNQAECPEDNPNIMAPGYEFKFKMNLERSGIEEGIGLIEVLIWEEGHRDEAVKVKYLVNQTTSSSPFSKTALKVFPNPADNYFRVEGVQDISKAIVYNIVGEEMVSFNVSPERLYDISHLNSGIYLVKLVRNNGKIAKTIRLSKR